MDFVILLQVLLKHSNRFQKIFLLVSVLLLDLRVHFHLSHVLRNEFLLKLSGTYFQLRFNLDQLGCVVKSVFESFDLVALIRNSCSLAGNLFLESFFIFEKVCNELGQTCIQRVQIFQLFIHFVGFSFHSSDLLFSWSNIFFQIFDFMIQDIFELFKLLGLFF